MSHLKKNFGTNKITSNAETWGENGILFEPALFYDVEKYCASP